MIELTKTINDPSGIVKKLIFEDETAIAEVVLYRYEDRGVICFSVQSGCRVGCSFCGTGKKFIRNLSTAEMTLQIRTGMYELSKWTDGDGNILPMPGKVQIMSMSMGEPLDNWEELKPVIEKYLELGHYFFVSSVGLDDFRYTEIYDLSNKYQKFGFQFSLHHTNDSRRKKLLGSYDRLLHITRLTWISKEYAKNNKFGNVIYFNYIARPNTNIQELYEIVKYGHLTVSVLSSKMLEKPTEQNLKLVDEIYNGIQQIDPIQPISIFNPSGQDTIGGGCGQLLYVQEKLKGFEPNH